MGINTGKAKIKLQNECLVISIALSWRPTAQRPCHSLSQPVNPSALQLLQGVWKQSGFRKWDIKQLVHPATEPSGLASEFTLNSLIILSSSTLESWNKS